MHTNTTKQKLLSAIPVYGLIHGSADPMLAEWAGLSGFDYYMLDGEHSLFNPAEAVNLVRACELTGITPLVRLGSKDPKLVLQHMDSGFMGVMMPGLGTVEETRMLIEAVKYPPQGRRGLGPIRANQYHMGRMTQAEYVEWASRETMVITQFEEESLLSALPEICALPGLDAVMVGPRDLSLSMGFPEGPEGAEVQAVIDRAIGIITGAGKTAGITAVSREHSEAQVARGARMILAKVQDMFVAGAQAFLSSIN